MCGVALEKKRKGKDSGLLMGKGGGVGEEMVDSGPLTLVFVGAWLEFGSTVNEVVATGEQFQLLGVCFGIEIAHDEEVGVLSFSTYGISVCLEHLTDVHA